MNYKKFLRAASAALVILAVSLVSPSFVWAASKYKVLYTVNYPGRFPVAGLIFDAAGNLYGTTVGQNGSVFELTPGPNGQWTETLLAVPWHGLGGVSGLNGFGPYAGVIFD